MKPVGWLLIAVSIVIALFAWNFDTTVTTTVPSPIGYGLTDTQTIVNIGKQQQQMMLLLTGGALFLSGVLLVGLGELQATMIESRAGIARLLKSGLRHDIASEPADEAQDQASESAVDAESVTADPWSVSTRNAGVAREVWLAIAGVILLTIIIFGFARMNAPQSAAIEANAAALADNLELQADNLEAEADAIVRNSR